MISERDMARAAAEYLSGELGLGCWFECPEGRYQLVGVERRVRTHVDQFGVRDGDAGGFDIRLKLRRAPVVADLVYVRCVMP